MIDRRAAKRPGWIDVSVPLRTGMVHWPDNPPVVVERTMDLGKGDGCTVSRLSMGAHTGTHMDAPSHFVREGATLDGLPFDAVVGRARVIAIRSPRAVTVDLVCLPLRLSGSEGAPARAIVRERPSARRAPAR